MFGMAGLVCTTVQGCMEACDGNQQWAGEGRAPLPPIPPPLILLPFPPTLLLALALPEHRIVLQP